MRKDSPKKSTKTQRDSQIFALESQHSSAGDQPQAIAKITHSFKQGARYATLLGVTGSGKTFTMANIIATLNMPTLIMTQLHIAQMSMNYTKIMI